MAKQDPYEIYAEEKARQVSRDSPEHKRLMDEAKKAFDELMASGKAQKGNRPNRFFRNQKKSEG